MMTIINLILITIIVCFIVDCSGVMTDIRKFVAKQIFKYTKVKVDYAELKLKPIGCSLCSTWWIGLIYLLFVCKFTIPYIAFVAFLSLISSNISGLLLTIKDYLAAFEMWLQKLIQK